MKRREESIREIRRMRIGAMRSHLRVEITKRRRSEKRESRGRMKRERWR
jgi:hypothetical protein